MSEATRLFENPKQLAAHLRLLLNARRNLKLGFRGSILKRKSISLKNRNAIEQKTGGRCHICGGRLDANWSADHVLAHSHGGAHLADNYLPAHNLCNNYRWFYGAEEFQWILKLGVWFRMRIEKEDDVALKLTERFVRHEAHRDSRKKTNP